ncbi:MAG: cation-translocating P-type ATPase [Chloroflexi bacterium]|nr:cation-translocating P-type ATPase [Chloroflexota bacterium]
MDVTANKAWHTQAPEAVVTALRSHFERGLNPEDAARRLAEEGPNELKEQPRQSFWAMLLDQFKNFLVIILIIASLVSMLLGDWVEAAAILTIVILNAVLGVVQESKAEAALAALQKMAAPEADVIRGGHRLKIPARELVRGDIVLLEAGNYLPADLRLLEAINLRIDEASLTGESEPVRKEATGMFARDIPLGDRRNMAYTGTLVTYGRGRGLVVNTAMYTQLGLIADMIQSYEKEPTPLQKKLDRLGKTLGWGALAVCALVFLIGWLRGSEPLEMFITAVSLAIAAVPEGLPAVVTICLALGMQRMVGRNALLRRLPAVEALGSATAICSDKTGTLTENQMTVVRMVTAEDIYQVTGEGYRPEGAFYEITADNYRPDNPSFLPEPVQIDPQQKPEMNLLLRAAAQCNDAMLEPSGEMNGVPTWRMVGDPTEGALITMATKGGVRQDELATILPRVAEVPFDSERKAMSTIHEIKEDRLTEQMRLNLLEVLKAKGLAINHGQTFYVAYVKGGPDVILDQCGYIYREGRVEPLDGKTRQHVDHLNHDLAADALRVLGFAINVFPTLPEATPEAVERDLVFVGLAGMIDPPRSEVKAAVQMAREAGIRTVMITGDYPDTARAIAEQIGMLRASSEVMTGRELDGLDDDTLTRRAANVDVYARVSPQHKVRIVEALRANNHIVAMTGDGVNDAPALKRADIGVAMGITGTDVAKETADMVLTDDNYASIVSAVEEGRVIYSNIRKFVFYLLSCNVGEVLIIFLATLLNWPLPLTAIQLLVLNLITDGAPALALGLEKGDPDVMKRPPRPPDEPVINREMVWRIVIQGLAITAATLLAFRIGLRWFPDNVHVAQTMAFATLSISELLRAYTSRSERYNLWQIGPFSNRIMQYAVAASLVILLAVIYVPFLDPIFDTAQLGLREWSVVVPLLLVPAVVAEITKFFVRGRAEQAFRFRMEEPV